MDQFLKLPTAQKAAVLAAVLAVLGLGMYFLLVDPELARETESRQTLAGLERDIEAVGGHVTLAEQERLRKLKDQLIEADKENRKMLPAAEEIPDFIENVQHDARRVGLKVDRFDRLPEEIQDLYNSVPIKMTVEGSMLQLIEFLRVYAGPERRVVNVRDLAIEQVTPDQTALKLQLDKSRPVDEATAAAAAATPKARTPEMLLLEQIELMELARKDAKVRATFTAYAFTWTGKAGVRPEGAPAEKKQKKKRT